MEQLDQHISAKRRIAARYTESLGGVPGIGFMPEAPWASSIFWMYTVTVDESEYGASSRALLKRLADKQIQARPLWQPLHRSKAHPQAQAYGVEVADHLHASTLSLPCSVGLTDEEMDRVVDVIRSGLR
jgi:dTDP-4-amino-4,6-dideoxygalactose transaminase